MKTEKQIIDQIDININAMKDGDLLPRMYNRLARENNHLKEVLMYLETNPRESFVVSELERVRDLIVKKESQYSYWSSNVCPDDVDVKKRKQMFNRELGILKLKKQLKTLKFILT